MEPKEIDILLAKHFAGETSAEEEFKLQRWIESNTDEYLSLKALLNNVYERQNTQLFSADTAWKKVSTKINFQNQKKQIFSYWLAAASVLLIATVSFLFYRNSTITASTLAMEVKTIKLDDGTLITLNGNSTVTYPRFFGKKREVALVGEAYFEVKHDHKHPFAVQTDRLKVNVLGTSFLVSTGSSPTVSVTSGKVAVKNVETNQLVTLIKGQSTKVIADKLIINKLSSDNYLAWKTKNLTFNNIPLSEVFSDMENFYQVVIDVDGGQGKNCKVNTQFKNQSLQQALNELSLVFGFKYSINGKNVTIFNLKCANND